MTIAVIDTYAECCRKVGMALVSYIISSYSRGKQALRIIGYGESRCFCFIAFSTVNIERERERERIIEIERERDRLVERGRCKDTERGRGEERGLKRWKKH